MLEQPTAEKKAHLKAQRLAFVDYQQDWEMGHPVGVWGGKCTCPDGRVYYGGDEGNMCGSIACHGGVQGEARRSGAPSDPWDY